MEDLEFFFRKYRFESGTSQVCEPSMHSPSLRRETIAVRLPLSKHHPWQPEAINKQWSYVQEAVLSFIRQTTKSWQLMGMPSVLHLESLSLMRASMGEKGWLKNWVSKTRGSDVI